ncbi:MAG: outer membrane protein assembly factor BamD [Alistipes sp.]|nr:outer membrane protein assembly factor BamD [Alistipes sp.]
MIRASFKTTLILLCSILVVGTASARKEQLTVREKVELGKKVSIHRLVKSEDPELIYSEALKYYDKKKWKQSGDLFEACQAYYVGDMREDSIAFFLARSKFKNRDYLDATVRLDEFRRKFGRSVFIEDAEAMLAMCHYYLAPDPTRDQTITAEAIVAFSEFIERYPNSKRAEAFSNIIIELTERLKEKAYLNAYTYYKIQRYKSAVVALRNALKQYPDTPRREDILYLIAVSNYRLAHNSIEEKQGDRYLNVLDSYYSFINEFPESKHRKELERYVKEAKDYLDTNNIEKQK